MMLTVRRAVPRVSPHLEIVDTNDRGVIDGQAALPYAAPPVPRARKQSPATQTETGAEAMSRLADGVERVGDELRVVRDVLDEVREEFVWAVRNDRFRCPPHIVHLTSMAANPLAADFGERLNRLKPEDLSLDQSPPDPLPTRAKQPQPGTLFDCCDEP